MNGIERIQPNNIYRVKAINLFENRDKNSAGNNKFNSNLFSYNSNNSYNLNHPQVFGNETKAKSLDFLA